MSDYFYSMHMLIRHGWAETLSYDIEVSSIDEYVDVVINLSYEENM